MLFFIYGFKYGFAFDVACNIVIQSDQILNI